MIVSLAYPDVLLAGHVATLRATSNLFKRRQHKHGAQGGFSDFHFAGALAELAVAKSLGLYWPPPLDDFDACDVGGLVDVRATPRADGRLIVHPDDAADRPFVLARLHDLPNVSLVGWKTAGEAQRPEYWIDPGNGRPAYFVPESALARMDTLPAWLTARRAA